MSYLLLHASTWAPTEVADGNYAQFTAILAIVGKVQRISLEDLAGLLKIKPTLRKRGGTLDRIASDLHLVIVATNKNLASAHPGCTAIPPPAR